MNIEERLGNYLSLLKSEVEVYIHGTIESSNKDSKDLLKSSLLEILLCQENTYNFMCSLDYYKVNNVPSSNIKKVYDKLK